MLTDKVALDSLSTMTPLAQDGLGKLEGAPTSSGSSSACMKDGFQTCCQEIKRAELAEIQKGAAASLEVTSW